MSLVISEIISQDRSRNELEDEDDEAARVHSGQVPGTISSVRLKDLK